MMKKKNEPSLRSTTVPKHQERNPLVNSRQPQAGSYFCNAPKLFAYPRYCQTKIECPEMSGVMQQDTIRPGHVGGPIRELGLCKTAGS